MEFRQEVIEFTSTQKALESFQRLLLCCQCSKLTKNVCTLGNCEHFFCKPCVEEMLGANCPVCGTPADARDARVNRQLSNIVSVSLELDRVLRQQLDYDEKKGEDQAEAEPIFSTPGSSRPSVNPRQNISSSKTSAHPSSHQAKSPQCSPLELQHQEMSSTNTRTKRSQGQLPRKAAMKNGRKENYQTTLTQLCDDQQSDNSDKEIIATTHRARKAAFDKGPSPQTRVRNKQRQTGSCITPHGMDQITLTQFFDDEQTKTSLSSTDEGNSTVSKLQFMEKPRRRAHHKRAEDKDSSEKTASETDNGSKSCHNTPKPLFTRGNRSRSHNKDLNETATSFDSSCSSEDKSVAASLSCTPSAPRRRSAPVKKTPEIHRRDPAISARRRRSVPSAQVTGISPSITSSPASTKSSVRKGSRNNLGRVKRNAKGETPLHVAAIKGDIAAVKELLSKGDNPNVRDNAGWTPLHETVNHGHVAVAKVLLQHGAMVNTPGMDNDTPLHDAVTNNQLECVRLLLKYGASVFARNIHGKTALDMATTERMKAALSQQPTSQVVTPLPKLDDDEEFLSLCFLGTALSRDQRSLLQKCATKLHAKVVDEFCPEVTHVVSSVNPDGQCPRTLKYLHGILGGKWIVSIDWISICLEYGVKVSEEPFEVPGSSTHPNSKASHNARINRRRQQPPLFHGCQMYLHGSFTRLPPSKPELMDLVQLGGARLLTREPRLTNLDEYDVTVPYHASRHSSLTDCGILIVHDGGSNVPVVKAERMCSVPASWVIECIATFSLVEP